MNQSSELKTMVENIDIDDKLKEPLKKGSAALHVFLSVAKATVKDVLGEGACTPENVYKAYTHLMTEVTYQLAAGSFDEVMKQISKGGVIDPLAIDKLGRRSTGN